ncbi:MAG: HlyD family efflux transporter periplasmic adaptor subunit [Gammaproteobacteria bacterium]|nr:HlyD family efflux transporter periplasmic adaptor subunit [Gammaproteobacteria bacterium]
MSTSLSSHPLFTRVKAIAIPILIILVAVAVFVYMSKTKPEQPPVEVEEKVWLVDVQTAEFERLSPVQTLFGKVESSVLVQAAAPISGVIGRVSVKEGQVVAKGEPLVSISLADLQIPLRQAEADVADAQAQVKLQKLANKANTKRLAYETKVKALKQATVRRTQQLIKRDLASQSDLDAVNEALVRQEFSVVGAQLAVEENHLKRAQNAARLTKAQAALSLAKLNFERGQLVAPYDVRVAKVFVSEGSRVNMGAPLISFYGLDSLELRAKLPVTALAKVQQAMRSGVPLVATFSESLGSNKAGQSEKVALTLSRLAGEATTSGLDAFFTLPVTLLGKRPGDLMEISLQGQGVESVVAIPYSALYGQNRVYLVEAERLVAHQVQVVGDVSRNGQLWALIKPDFEPGAHISITHLPNAVTGLKVKEVAE